MQRQAGPLASHPLGSVTLASLAPTPHRRRLLNLPFPPLHPLRSRRPPRRDERLVGSADAKAQMWPRGSSHPGSRPEKPSTGPWGKAVGCQLEGGKRACLWRGQRLRGASRDGEQRPQHLGDSETAPQPWRGDQSQDSKRTQPVFYELQPPPGADAATTATGHLFV